MRAQHTWPGQSSGPSHLSSIWFAPQASALHLSSAGFDSSKQQRSPGAQATGVVPPPSLQLSSGIGVPAPVEVVLLAEELLVAVCALVELVLTASPPWPLDELAEAREVDASEELAPPPPSPSPKRNSG
jgi:hypothetical protein